MTTQTPEELFKKCPILLDIANRLEDSEKDANKTNADNKSKSKRVKQAELPLEGQIHVAVPSYAFKYPEHCRIIEIYRNGAWENMANMPKPGKENFLKTLVSTVDTRNPKGLKIEIYAGKRPTSSKESFTCWLVDKDAEIVEEEKRGKTPGLGFAEEMKEVKNELAKFKTINPEGVNPATMQMMFDMKLQTLEHKQEIERIKSDFERKLEKKDEEIYDLRDEVEELTDQLTELDGELSGAADLIEAKQKPQPLSLLLTDVFQNGLVALAYRNQHILKDWGLSQESIKLMWENQQKQIASAPQAPSENSEASFTEVKNEYAHQTPEHAEVAKTITAFINQLSFEHFKLLYTVLFFCSNEGELHTDHVNKMIAHIYEISQKETE